jgi:DNA repair ATPase RecN
MFGFFRSGHADDVGGLDSQVPPEVMKQWNQDWSNFVAAMKPKEEEARNKITAIREKLAPLEQTAEPSDEQKAEMRTLAKEITNIKVAYYEDKLASLKQLKSKYGQHPELVQKLDKEINDAQAQIEKAKESYTEYIKKHGLCIVLLGVESCT